MRIPSYMSPTSLAFWGKGAEKFYLQYLADHRPPRFAQTEPMSVGSAFDAWVKSYLYAGVFGTAKGTAYDLEPLFEEQVESHNRDFARIAGEHAFNSYVKSGAYADLLKELQAAQSEPRFETKLQGTVHDMPMLGKPDLYYVSRNWARIILDWKVNGYCGKNNTSPKPGYMMCRDGWDDFTPSKTNGRAHKDVMPWKVNGVNINANRPLEAVDASWARQVATYAWLLGCPVGSEFVVAIDQLACGPGCKPLEPHIRVAEHRAIITEPYQQETLQAYKDLWEIINSGYILRELPLEEAKSRQRILDSQYKAFEGEDAELMKEIADRGNQMF